jgi:hypothetical protein
MAQRTARHRGCDRFADRAIVFDKRYRHCQHFAFRLVAIGHKTTLEPVRATREIGKGFGDQAAGAGFRGTDFLLGVQQCAG